MSETLQAEVKIQTSSPYLYFYRWRPDKMHFNKGEEFARLEAKLLAPEGYEFYREWVAVNIAAPVECTLHEIDDR